MRFEGALHIYDGAKPSEAVRQAVAFSRHCGWGRAIGLGSEALPARHLTRLATVRSRYAEIIDAVPSHLPVIYHQLTGMDLFATEDAGRHRFFWIQESFVRWATVMGWAARYADAFIHETEETAEEMQTQVNWVPEKRRATIGSAQAAKDSAARETLSRFLDLPIKRQLPSPHGVLNVVGFYRRQIRWIV